MQQQQLRQQLTT